MPLSLFLLPKKYNIQRIYSLNTIFLLYFCRLKTENLLLTKTIYYEKVTFIHYDAGGGDAAAGNAGASILAL